ncbi:MAG: MmgE/PrpD family protein, partial [Chloroflexi bacterium]|nr:MmgE/PrpD family protein [Chloroflexota bacterium]
IDAALELYRQHHPDPSRIEKVEVDVTEHGIVNRPTPRTGLEGKFSVQYVVTVALLDGKIGIDTFTDERRFSPDVESLLPKVRARPDPSITEDIMHTHAIVTVTLSDGQVCQTRCDKPRGMWGVPLSRQERLVKYRDCTYRAVSAETAERILELVDRFEEQPNVAELMDLVRG